jgi:OPA family sugar phosphate sensor protein UhpC-like MFS transporter
VEEDASQKYSGEFIRTRLMSFAGIVLGYSCFYLTRNSLTYTAPAMVADATLGITMTDVRVLFVDSRFSW